VTAIAVTVTATVAITVTIPASVSCRPLLLLLLSLELWRYSGIGERTDPVHVFEFGGRYPLGERVFFLL